MPDFALSQEVLAEAQAAEQALAAAKAYNVATADDYSSAGEELKSLTARARRLEDMRVNLKAPALEQCRRIDEFFRAPQQFIEDAKMAIKRALGVYDTQQRKLREEAERKAEEIARRERKRLAAEAAKIEEEARKKREAAETRALALEEAGKSEKAEASRRAAEEAEALKRAQADALRRAADTVTAPTIHIDQPQVAGLSSSERWHAEVTDLKALIQSVAEGTTPISALQADMKVLNQMARALKSNMNYPGVRAIPDTTYSARSA